jgi:predicted hydrocarbon binding protein
MNLSDKIELFFLAFLGRTGIIDIRNLILEGKLKLSPSMAYEFSVDGLAAILINEVKRIVELMPSKANDIIFKGARDSGKEAIFLLKERLRVGDSIYDLDKALMLMTNCFRMNREKGGWRRKISKKETTGNVVECPFLKIILKEKLPQVCLVCEGFCQGIADAIEKGSSITIPKKMSKGDKYCEFIVRRTKPVKEPYSEMKLNLTLDFIHEFTVREIGRILVKIGKRTIKATTPKTYKNILFWGARDAGREVAEMMKKLGIKDGLNAVEAGTVFFAQSSRMKRVQIKISEKENIGHVFVCPWANIAIKDKLPQTCMMCEGFCQGVADAMTKDCIAEIPKKMTKGNEYCKFVYRKVK